MSSIPLTAPGREYVRESGSARAPMSSVASHPSGLEPLGRAILVEPYAPDRDRARGVIFIPQAVLDNEQALDVKVRVVSLGPLAWENEPIARAAPGDVVLVSKHSGWMATGLDGKSYRFVNDREVFGKVKEQSHG